MNDFLTIKEASNLTRYSVKTLYNYVSVGIVPYHKMRGRLLFKKDELLAWMQGEVVTHNVADQVASIYDVIRMTSR